jgi:hypothetical protein
VHGTGEHGSRVGSVSFAGRWAGWIGTSSNAASFEFEVRQHQQMSVFILLVPEIPAEVPDKSS